MLKKDGSIEEVLVNNSPVGQSSRRRQEAIVAEVAFWAAYSKDHEEVRSRQAKQSPAQEGSPDDASSPTNPPVESPE